MPEELNGGEGVAVEEGARTEDDLILHLIAGDLQLGGPHGWPPAPTMTTPPHRRVEWGGAGRPARRWRASRRRGVGGSGRRRRWVRGGGGGRAPPLPLPRPLHLRAAVPRHIRRRRRLPRRRAARYPRLAATPQRRAAHRHRQRCPQLRPHAVLGRPPSAAAPRGRNDRPYLAFSRGPRPLAGRRLWPLLPLLPLLSGRRRRVTGRRRSRPLPPAPSNPPAGL